MLWKAISSKYEHGRFVSSSSKGCLVKFVQRLNRSCAGRRRAPRSTALVGLLRLIRRKVDEFPPTNADGRRFGDGAFRTFHSWLDAEAPGLLVTALGDDVGEADLAELGGYLGASFGDPQRLDYGTGHETSFVVFLYCLWRVGVLVDVDVDGGSVVLDVIAEYLATCRHVQRTYVLEPAGSRGVWALDDYQVLAFLFGSSQHLAAAAAAASEEEEEKPPQEPPVGKAGYAKGNDLDVALVERHAPTSLFFQGLDFATKSKTGATFAEASPILFSYATKPWRAINRAIFLYYDAEVLGTFVVARHLLFGDLFPASWQQRPALGGPQRGKGPHPYARQNQLAKQSPATETRSGKTRLAATTRQEEKAQHQSRDEERSNEHAPGDVTHGTTTETPS